MIRQDFSTPWLHMLILVFMQKEVFFWDTLWNLWSMHSQKKGFIFLTASMKSLIRWSNLLFSWIGKKYLYLLYHIVYGKAYSLTYWENRNKVFWFPCFSQNKRTAPVKSWWKWLFRKHYWRVEDFRRHPDFVIRQKEGSRFCYSSEGVPRFCQM